MFINQHPAPHTVAKLTFPCVDNLDSLHLLDASSTNILRLVHHLRLRRVAITVEKYPCAHQTVVTPIPAELHVR